MPTSATSAAALLSSMSEAVVSEVAATENVRTTESSEVSGVTDLVQCQVSIPTLASVRLRLIIIINHQSGGQTLLLTRLTVPR